MQKYTYDPHFYPYVSPEATDGAAFYLASEVNETFASMSAMFADKAARVAELEQSSLELRDSFNAVCNRRDELVATNAELEKALREAIKWNWAKYAPPAEAEMIVNKALGVTEEGSRNGT